LRSSRFRSRSSAPEVSPGCPLVSTPLVSDNESFPDRRREQNVVRKSLGFNWGAAGLSTALFTGEQQRPRCRGDRAPEATAPRAELELSPDDRVQASTWPTFSHTRSRPSQRSARSPSMSSSRAQMSCRRDPTARARCAARALLCSSEQTRLLTSHTRTRTDDQPVVGPQQRHAHRLADEWSAA
jgi:hypothetical protein